MGGGHPSQLLRGGRTGGGGGRVATRGIAVPRSLHRRCPPWHHFKCSHRCRLYGYRIETSVRVRLQDRPVGDFARYLEHRFILIVPAGCSAAVYTPRPYTSISDIHSRAGKGQFLSSVKTHPGVINALMLLGRSSDAVPLLGEARHPPWSCDALLPALRSPHS